MHIVANFPAEVDSTLELFENVYTSGTNPFAFDSKSGTFRLVRTACKALTSRGRAKLGANSQWESFLTDISEINHIVTFVGSRFNIVFKNAASLFYHRVHLKDFLSLIPDPNLLLKSIKFDIDEPVYLAGIRALGIIDKVITGPFWRLLERKGTSILDTNMYLHQMQIQLEFVGKRCL